MKRTLLSLILICLFSAICINEIGALTNKKEMSFTEKRDIEYFNSIEVGSVFNVYISKGSSNKLEIKSTHDILNNIITEVINGKLIIKLKDNHKGGAFFKRGNMYSNLSIDICVSSDKLNGIYASGSCDVYSNELLRAKDIVIVASGASDVKLDLEVEGDIKCTASGSSDVILSGNATSVGIIASGASDVNGKKLFVKNAKIVSSGSSDVDINVSESLSMAASGASDISYIGNPKILNKKVSGSADIIRK